MNPHRHLKDQEPDIFLRIMVTNTYRVPFAVCPATCIDDMKYGICLAKVIKELVAQSLALMGIGDQPGDIDQVYSNKPIAVNTVPAGKVEILARAFRSYMGYAKIRIDGRKRIVGNLDIGHGRCLEKCRLSAVGFSRKGQSDHVWFLITLFDAVLALLSDEIPVFGYLVGRS
jgi:hypothetical protein